jgi:hypothetical protein
LAAGFEDRRLAFADTVANTSGDSAAVVLRYRPQLRGNDLEGVVEHLRRLGFREHRTKVVEFDRFAPHAFAGQLKAALQQLGSTHVLLDMSAMSKLAIMLCLDVLREAAIDVDVFCAEAKRYRPSEKRFHQAWQNRDDCRPSLQIYTGVQKVVRVSRLCSVAMQGQPTAAIAFMSFNEELVQALINTVSPSRLLLVNCRPPVLGWRERATAWIHETLVKEWGEEDNPLGPDGLPLRSASTRDYTETVSLLLDLYWRNAPSYRIVLAPTGSKMQTLGCFIVRALHSDIHIEYPTPIAFRAGRASGPKSPGVLPEASVVQGGPSSELDLYSTDIGPRWLVHLGPLNETIGRLRMEEREARLGFSSTTAV